LICDKYENSSSQSSGFSFRFQEGENIALSAWPFNISDELSAFFTNESNSDLSNTTSGASFTNDVFNFSEYDFNTIHSFQKFLPACARMLADGV